MIKQLLSIGMVSLTLASCTSPKEKAYNLIVGCNVQANSNGIVVYRFDPISGKTTLLHTHQGVANASFQALSSDQKQLYTFSEVNKPQAKVYSYTYEAKAGKLSLPHTQPIESDGPCSIWVDSQNSALATANYSGGSISFFLIGPNGQPTPLSKLIEFSGSGADASRQSQPHLHSVYASPDEQYLFANDLGTDRIYKFELVREEGKIVDLKEGTPAWFATPPADGPRHSDFHPNGKFLYTLGELSGNVSLYNYEQGNLTFIKSFEADSLRAAGSADIHISLDGKFLYASNRIQGDGIAIFHIDEQNGALHKVGYQPTGKHPRNFALSPDGNFLLCANRDDNQVEVFRINRETGLLTNTQQDIVIESPVCLTFSRAE
ncbi:MAG: lactonase family protein [Phocaeicola sp.]